MTNSLQSDDLTVLNCRRGYKALSQIISWSDSKQDDRKLWVSKENKDKNSSIGLITSDFLCALAYWVDIALVIRLMLEACGMLLIS